MGGREDGSAGTNQELKTAAAPLGDSGSFLWSSGGGAPAVPAGLGRGSLGRWERERAEVGSLHPSTRGTSAFDQCGRTKGDN